jgi:hypothetical protein
LEATAGGKLTTDGEIHLPLPLYVDMDSLR